MLLTSLSTWGDTENVETNGLRKRSALTNSDLVTFFDTESWGNVSSYVLVALFVTVVLWNVVKVVTSDDNGTVHLGGNNSTGQNLTTDGNQTDEWALLVNVVTIDGFSWGLETKTNFLVPSLGFLVDLSLRVLENVRLLD